MKKVSRILLFLMFLFVFLENLFNKHNPYTQDLLNQNLLPLKEGHLLGTDYLGRDILARLSQGIQSSLIVITGVVVLTLIISLILGSIMGYYGNSFDKVLLFVMEIFLSIPSLLIILILAVFLGNSLPLLIFSLSFTRSLRLTLLVRNEVKKVKLQNYVIISEIMGASKIYTIRKHILPNILSIVITKMLLMIPGIVFSESFLSFLGVGIALPRASIGNLIQGGFSSLLINPTQFIFASISLIILCFSFGGLYEDRD